MMAATAQAASNTLKVIRCTEGGETYLLEARWVHSIIRLEAMEPNRSGSGPVGWVAAREGKIPVYNLASRLGAAQAGPSTARSAVVIRGPKLWALQLDRLSRGTDVPFSRVFPIVASVLSQTARAFAGAVRLDDRFFLLLSPRDLRPSDLTGPSDAEMPALRSLVARAAGGRAAKPVLTKRGRHDARVLRFAVAADQVGGKPVDLALSVSQVAEILRPLPTMPVPGAPGYVLGLADWRSRPVPVLNLAGRLGLRSLPEADLPRLLVARGPQDESMVGFPVAAGVRALGLPLPEARMRDDAPVSASLIQGCVELPDAVLLFPDVNAILNYMDQ